jgi:hypothetical protein
MKTEETEVVADEMLITKEEVEAQLMSSGLERLFAQQSEGIVNPIVLAKALGVKPQMIYNYIKNGKITAVKQNNTQKLVISWSEAIDFAQRYLNRKLRRQQAVEAELQASEA